jgi:hypothetical protein
LSRERWQKRSSVPIRLAAFVPPFLSSPKTEWVAWAGAAGGCG